MEEIKKYARQILSEAFGHRMLTSEIKEFTIRVLLSVRRESLEEAAKIADQHAMRLTKPINEIQFAVDDMARRIAGKLRTLVKENGDS